MSIEYIPTFIEGITVDEINAELKDMSYRQYAYGQSMDRPRMWDLEHTKKVLKGDKGGTKCTK